MAGLLGMLGLRRKELLPQIPINRKWPRWPEPDKMPTIVIQTMDAQSLVDNAELVNRALAEHGVRRVG